MFGTSVTWIHMLCSSLRLVTLHTGSSWSRVGVRAYHHNHSGVAVVGGVGGVEAAGELRGCMCQRAAIINALLWTK